VRPQETGAAGDEHARFERIILHWCFGTRNGASPAISKSSSAPMPV
jgi:hypothetical protein